VTWDGVVRLRGDSLEALAGRHGGEIRLGKDTVPERLVPVEHASVGDLAPLLSARLARAARDASARGATLLVERTLSSRIDASSRCWIVDHAAWTLAALLHEAIVPDAPPAVGSDCAIAPTAVLGPRVVIGKRVRIGAGAVVGHPGFGWAFGPGGAVRPMPQLGGVVIEDDVSIGPLCTVDAGTLAPTRVRQGAKLDAHVHVAHNVDVGEGCIVAAQSGFAGSVLLGKGALVGGQVGIADHVIVGEGARIAAKSGVIGDVPPGAVVAGYPAVPRARWLRALAKLYAFGTASGTRRAGRAGGPKRSGGA
jgi:UDP-3-O-[3-hydroxymyristoyl] glucosamine N-acyltransferase